MGKEERPVYYISARPEAYEMWGEIGREEAARLAALIAERAGMRFPGIAFRIDDEWHVHPEQMTLVTAFIADNMLAWMAEGGGS